MYYYIENSVFRIKSLCHRIVAFCVHLLGIELSGNNDMVYRKPGLETKKSLLNLEKEN